ncbi:MAG: hypothetical protein ACI9XK_004224 [Granulosicoccus sp.]|jgi:hypothetical protein
MQWNYDHQDRDKTSIKITSRLGMATRTLDFIIVLLDWLTLTVNEKMTR